MLEFINKFRAGESGYYTERKRGTVVVHYDAYRYIYRKPHGSLVEFKKELAEAFAGRGMPPARVSGAYPSYSVD